ncbi:hypothetical protein HHK36_015677 [Tetracentron sinense]|uniref:Glycoside hydrolase family 5 domain-containing protein n=1 Tax=Tetracentron sinense TaxID=13715 RepID=A0A834Z6M3_TETSI|nr:hypothetical protein HHK36_015677 [Tetracentron sinense]
MTKLFLFALLLFLTIFPNVLLQRPAMALPLSTDSRWIVDESGQRVKLACVNWASHLETMVAEGLSKQPLDDISKRIVSMGFNCVRLTWPLFLVTNDSFASVTVRQSFQSLGLLESVAGIQANNPSMLDLPLIQAYQVVVSNLGDNNLMVILDNHISKPGWCCSNFDGNGFFGDRYFAPDLWLKGLTRMAAMFNGVTCVVGMSLRNELRGSKQNISDWYRYMEQGAEAVHSSNPDVLIILSGLNYDKDLSFLVKQPVDLTFTGKLVFEVHWYSFSDGKAWETGNANQVCGSVVNNMMRKGGFLLEQGWPLFLSEFGVDQRGSNVNDNRYLNCFFGVAAELDLDWALWTLVGSYSLREGVMGMDETYGLLTWSWCGTRNSSFLQRISALQSPFQGTFVYLVISSHTLDRYNAIVDIFNEFRDCGVVICEIGYTPTLWPGLSNARVHKIIFHPSTGLCVRRNSGMEPLKLGSCSESDAWTYTPQKLLYIKGTYYCLQADGLGKPAKLTIICTQPGTKWEMISDSKMHLSTKLADDSTVCLDIDSSNTIITNPCKCLSRDQTCDPGSQWFKLANSTRSTTSTKLSLSKNLLWNSLRKYLFGLESLGLQDERRSSQ